MPELSLSLVTKQEVSLDSAPLDKIWSLDHWLSALDRVCGIKRISESAVRQHFILFFDADRPEPDQVEVERIRSVDKIRVTHLIPPPNVIALSAEWWTEAAHPGVLFASRHLLIEEDMYSPDMARKMFTLLRENIDRLTGRSL
ncbi:hypothetical protein CBW54_00610 [Yersinia kristensenii]|nr:hypothetical protein CBW54_00610 [Yersinia kristensenii]